MSLFDKGEVSDSCGVPVYYFLAPESNGTCEVMQVYGGAEMSSGYEVKMNFFHNGSEAEREYLEAAVDCLKRHDLKEAWRLYMCVSEVR